MLFLTAAAWWGRQRNRLLNQVADFISDGSSNMPHRDLIVIGGGPAGLLQLFEPHASELTPPFSKRVHLAANVAEMV